MNFSAFLRYITGFGKSFYDVIFPFLILVSDYLQINEEKS